MKITRPKTYDIKDPNAKRFTEDIFKLVNRTISFGTQVNGADQNIDGSMVEIADTGLANTQFTVTHNLQRTPLYVDVKYINVNGNIWSSAPATKTQSFYMCNVAHAHIRLFVH